MAEGDLELFREILENAVNWQAKIDQMTDRALVAKWPIARIDPTLRALFRAAGAELIEGDRTAEGRDHRIRRCRKGVLSRGQGTEVRERGSGPHGARGAPGGVLSMQKRVPGYLVSIRADTSDIVFCGVAADVGYETDIGLFVEMLRVPL